MFHARVLFLAAALTLCVSTPLCAQSQAVFTTDRDGNIVNGNRYGKPEQVYLRTAGIAPDGVYVFQVTNTSGTVLLSEDGPVDREVTISGGVIVDASKHDLGNEGKGKPGSPNVVQLAPFKESANGQYKVWLTQVGKLVTTGGYHGFVPADSKTDNFKVEKGKPSLTTTITGIKFYDANESKGKDTGETGLTGWRIELRKKGESTLLAVSFTDENGQYRFEVPRDLTEYDITEVAPIFADPQTGTVASDQGFIGQAPGARWLATTARSGTTPPADQEFLAGPDFGNVYFVPADTSTTGKLVYGIGFWHNSNGKAILAAKDDPSSPDPTWRELLTTIANPFGAGLPAPNPDPNYPFDWPYDCFATTTLSVPLSLRDNTGKLFAPPPHSSATFQEAFSAFSSWIVADDNGQAAFKLSREMAAAILNVKCGSLKDTTVYINTDPSAGLTNLVPFDALVYKVVCLLLRPEDSNGINQTGPNATGAWLELRNAIFVDLAGQDPYPGQALRLGRGSRDQGLHPLLRRLPTSGFGLTKQFSQINTSTEGAEDEAYVWEAETEVAEVPEPSEPYGEDPVGG